MLAPPLCGQADQEDGPDATPRRPSADSARRNSSAARADAPNKQVLPREANGLGLPAAVHTAGPPPDADADWLRNRLDSQEVPPGATIVAGSEQQAVAVVVTRIVNGSKEPVRNARIHMFTPLDLPHQQIHELEVEGEAATSSDEWGNSLATYQAEILEPGQYLSGRWSASFSMRCFQWQLAQPVHAPVDDLTPAERAFYLRDAKHFDIANSTLLAAVEQATRNYRPDDLGRVAGIFDHLAGNLRYKMDGKWDPAPQVLAAGTGSCSEFTFCFIAMCRGQGIPARYLGGINGKPNIPFHFDLAHHRFPQAFCPGLGWVDFDPTWSAGNRDKRRYFGQTPGPMLLLCKGDGTDAPLTGIDYVSTTRWQGGGKQASRVRHAWWLPAPTPEVERQVIGFRTQLLTLPGERRGEAIATALRIGHPMVLPWLDDLLYQPRWRASAARAALRIGGPAALEPVIDSLDRLGDSPGDLAVADVLRAYTGQDLGPQRKPWSEWFGKRNRSVRLPGETAQQAKPPRS
jgi:transglutaminase-like putative cysteine protease